MNPRPREKTKNHRRMLVVILSALGVISIADASLGQNLPRRYEPNRPTVSPYLNLLRNDDGLSLPSYYSFVRPLQRQNAVNQEQQAVIRQQQNSLRDLDQRTIAVQELQVRSTGTSSGFVNYSHFYQGKASSTAPRRASRR